MAQMPEWVMNPSIAPPSHWPWTESQSWGTSGVSSSVKRYGATGSGVPPGFGWLKPGGGPKPSAWTRGA
jgi:hypothetical protein